MTISKFKKQVFVLRVGGSKLISKKLMEAKDYATIESETIKVLELIKTIKK